MSGSVSYVYCRCRNHSRNLGIGKREEEGRKREEISKKKVTRVE